GSDDPGHPRNQAYRVSDLDLDDRNDHPPLAEEVEVAFTIRGPVGQRRVVEVTDGLEADRDRRRVADVWVLPPAVRELHRVLEVRLRQQAGRVPVERDLLELALQVAVDVAAPALPLLQESHQVPSSGATLETLRLQAIEE